jgi:hypothetical protein
VFGEQYDKTLSQQQKHAQESERRAAQARDTRIEEGVAEALLGL